jgi:hypothetical protein
MAAASFVFMKNGLLNGMVLGVQRNRSWNCVTYWPRSLPRNGGDFATPKMNSCQLFQIDQREPERRSTAGRWEDRTEPARSSVAERLRGRRTKERKKRRAEELFALPLSPEAC